MKRKFLNEGICFNLFLPKKYSNRNALKIKIFPQLIFQIIFVRLLNIVWKITEKSKRWSDCGNLSYVLNFNRMTSYNRRVISFYSL